MLMMQSSVPCKSTTTKKMLSEQQWLCENICLCTLEYSDSNKKHHLGESRSIKINCVFAFLRVLYIRTGIVRGNMPHYTFLLESWATFRNYTVKIHGIIKPPIEADISRLR